MLVDIRQWSIMIRKKVHLFREVLNDIAQKLRKKFGIISSSIIDSIKNIKEINAN